MATEKRSVDRKVVDVERNSPALIYDAVTTRVFPKLKHDRLALKLNGKDDNLRRADFQTLAATAGLRAGYSEAAIDELLQRLRLTTSLYPRQLNSQRTRGK